MLTKALLVALSVLVVAVGALAAGCSSSTSTSSSPSPSAPAPVANGTIGPWSVLAPLPVPRANHCSVVANGYLVVIGGNYKPKGATDFKNIDEVDVAKINADGSLGAWTKAGTTPAAVNSCTAVASGKTIVLLDGIYEAAAGATSPYEGKPQVATIGDDGMLSAFAPVSTLPTGARILYSTGDVSDGTLYTMFSRTTAEGDSVSLVTAPLDDAGVLGAFSEQRWLPGFRGHPAYAYALPFVYVLGGYDAPSDGGANQVVATGMGTQVTQGKAGTPFATAPLPRPTSFGAAVAVDSFVFAVGGKSEIFSANGSPSIFAGKVDATGAIASWSKLADMPAGRTSLSAVVGGSFLYVTGGGFDAGGLDTVFATQVRFAPPASP